LALWQVLRGHTDAINRIAWSPDGRLLASLSSDETIRIRDIERGEYLAILEGHERRVNRKDEADLKRVQKHKNTAKQAQQWGENRRRKQALAHIHERIANRRSDFAHKRSRDLIKRYQVIVFEDLEPQQMGARRGRGMRKSIMDV